MRSPVSLLEDQRLAELHSLKLLDSGFNQNLDQLTSYAASFYNVPIVAVSLIDENRQFFQSIHGLDVRETSREAAFCAHTIMSNDLLVVTDAKADDRFRDNPLVTQDPNIRFYAGIPLKLAAGVNLGALCLIDKKPRPEITDFIELESLAKEVIREIIAIAPDVDRLTPPKIHQPSVSIKKIALGEKLVFVLDGTLSEGNATDVSLELLSQVDKNKTQSVQLVLGQCVLQDDYAVDTIIKITQFLQDESIACQCSASEND